MKNVINFYYQINIENIHLTEGIYYFTYQNNNYQFIKTDRDPYALQNFYFFNQKIITNYPYYYEIVLTKDRLPYLIIDQNVYCLIKESHLINDCMSFYDIRNDEIQVDKSLQLFMRFPWISAWMERIDYIENILKHMETKTRNLLPIFYYFLGLGENAIQYVLHTVEDIRPEKQDKMCIAHHRISAKDSVSSLYFPLSLVIDHPARDIAEYLKSLFIENDYDMNEIEEYIESLNFSTYGFSLLFGRMLYPSFFFDLWDDIYLGRKQKKELLLLGERKEEYRIFLKEIYYLIRKKTPIEEIRWITRN